LRIIGLKMAILIVDILENLSGNSSADAEDFDSRGVIQLI